ncbi:chromatin structure remodeling complex protein RSC3 [Aspergillus sclerotiicarbonarius CBS 121057]|uniref:Chromatin structure remodeling complex protein RSC3 n=1 Tax=Aspergillus sclerotiicarbonarius (strain CBS 121057 / IBT 28362) TaxID=1448318 RepID=A0A319E5M0_ASPSB|nr:chromatin structure remodeling complex protein RSC3 [Aspergillus sclerotiicarbonarius CBS 121057]
MSAPRRNGQLSSCEPCRKSKLRCDHSAPVCNRCVRRGRSDLCVYHPAPLTRPREGPRFKATKNDANGILVPARTLTWESVSGSPASSSSVSVLGSAQFPNPTKLPFSGTGFLGPTSYSGTFSDNELGPVDRSSLTQSTPIDPQQVARGAQVLFLLENLALYEEVIEKRFSISPGWVLGPPLMRELFKVLGNVYRNATQDSTNKYARLMDLSRVFFRNTLTPIETHSSMVLSDYFALAGPRWEMISLLFAFTGTSTYQVPPHSLGLEQTDDITSKEGLRQICSQASETCLQFCNHLGTLSDPLAWAMMQHTVFLSCMHGSSDHRTWQMLGEITTTVFALGLHQPVVDTKTPFFLTEIRKRTMVGAYAIDKELATFLGRPPRICWRYCNIQYPLDLNYDEIVAEPEVRDAALQRLDSTGWNIDGRLDKGARARGSLIASIDQENALEVSLSNQLDGLEERVQNSCKKSDELRRSLPLYIQWTEDKANPYVASLHLEFLYHEFLLLQTLFKRTGKGNDALITKASEIITIILHMVSMETRAGHVHPSIIWDLCYIGLPSAGVLCTELLRRSQPHPNLLPSATPFPRSDIIQKLSVFVAQLKTFVRQQEGDYEICIKGQQIISQALDRVLSPAPLVVADSMPASNGVEEDVDFMAFLENFDWEQEMRLTFGC